MSTTTWNIDATHSEVGFKVRHLMISNVKGHFGKYSGSVTTEDDRFETAKISFEAETASISTGNEQRDGHLTSPDFFDAANHPAILFNSTAVTKISEQEFSIQGDLTMHGVTKNIEIKAVSAGVAKDPWGQTKTAFEISGKINRADFGLVWNAPLETGGVLLSEEVNLVAEVQMVKS